MGALLLFIYFVCVISAVLGSIFWPKRKQWLAARKLPGPPPLPLLGNAHQVSGNRHHSFKILVKYINEYGKIFRIWFGPKLVIVVSDPADVQLIIGDSKIRNRDYLITKAMLPFIGNGLLAARDDMWKSHRKLLTPTFHFKVLLTYVEIFGKKSQKLCETLEEFADGKKVDIHKYVSMCTMDAICETAIGIEMDVRSGGGMDFYNGIVQANGLGHNRVVRPWLLLNWLYPHTEEGKQAAELKKKVLGFTDTIVAKKLAEYRANKNNNFGVIPKEEEIGTKKVNTLLELLIEASENDGSQLTVKEMRDELTTIAAAGFDTTAISISNLFLMIGLYPDVQEKICQELDHIFNGDLRPASMDDINKMEYLDRTFKETLRLLPVVPLQTREISEDVVLPSGQVIPAGCSVICFSYMIHRDPRYFPEPERFVPDRWLPDESGTARHPYAYLPFSAGPRNCIGQKYAMLQMKSIASSVLRRFSISHSFKEDDLKEIDLSAATRLTAKYKIQLKRRLKKLPS